MVIVEFPYLIGMLAFPCAAVLLYRSVRAFISTGGQGTSGWPALAGALLWLCGGVVFTKRVEFHFDLVARELRWRRRGLFTNERGVVPLEQIRSASVESHSGGEGEQTYRVVLKTTGGPLPLTDSFSSGAGPCNDMRDAINGTLKRPVDAARQAEEQIVELALGGRKLEAVELVRQRYGYDLARAREFVDGLVA